MTLTIGNIVFLAMIVLFGIVGTISLYLKGSHGRAIAVIVITFILVICIALGISWWHTNTANGIRAMKDYQSNMDNGINREITITAEDGREIFHYEGKVDVETKHEGNANYILFESEDGLRYIIYYGITDTVLIIEKAS